MVKQLWNSRTVWLAVAQAGVGILTAFIAHDPTIANIGWVMIIKSALDFFLRIDTHTKLV